MEKEKEETNNINNKDFLEEWNYFLGRLNLGNSCLDCRSIQFMNLFSKYIDKSKQETQKELLEDLRKNLEPFWQQEHNVTDQELCGWFQLKKGELK